MLQKCWPTLQRDGQEISETVAGYIAGVSSGEIVAGKMVRRCVERHLHDLEHGPDRGLRFNEGEAINVISMFSILRHWKGEWAGRPFVLQPWQMFMLWVCFGWQKQDDAGKWVRRFRIAYNQIARKGGKTMLAGGVGMFLFMFDGEAAAEVYTAATKRDQARLAHNDAKQMVKASKGLRDSITITRDCLVLDATNSKYEPLGANADTLDGLSPNGVILDELHAHKSRDLFDVLDTATGARSQPMMWIITTAGVYRHESICVEQFHHAEKVLEGFDKDDGVKDDGFFAYVAMLDPEDDWQDPDVWIKANPGLGITPKRSYIERQVERAKSMLGLQNGVRTKNLNQWVQQDTALIDMAAWGRCKRDIPLAELYQYDAFLGMDMSSSRDLTAFAATFLIPPGGAHYPDWLDGRKPYYYSVVWFWVPGESAQEKSKMDGVPYTAWAEVPEYRLEMTEGNMIDQEHIARQVEDITRPMTVKHCGIDTWGAGWMVARLDGMGLDVYDIKQSYPSLAEPTSLFETAVGTRQMGHAGVAPLSWNVSNAAAEANPSNPDQKRISKKASNDRIDGVAAIINSYKCALSCTNEDDHITESPLREW
ncbi:MAG: terminase large subunit [Marivivens sp.]|nr:terminase large subunit [Marivivens sp.]NBT50033.1 terminase large subunit [Marivivens sp.]NCW67019.1 terminase large subunit [Marivivens sp.]NDH01521.1 terminase large subunit [Marivivens sp.]